MIKKLSKGIIPTLLGLMLAVPLILPTPAGAVVTALVLESPDAPAIFVPEGAAIPIDLGLAADTVEAAALPLLPWIDTDNSLDGVTTSGAGCDATATSPVKDSGALRARATFTCPRSYAKMAVVGCIQVKRSGQWNNIYPCYGKVKYNTSSVSVSISQVKCLSGTHKYRTKAGGAAGNASGDVKDQDVGRSAVVEIRCN